MRLLHTMLRVGDLERSIKFYTEILGMLRKDCLNLKHFPQCWASQIHRCVDETVLFRQWGPIT